MQSNDFRYSTKGLEDFIYGIHLNNLEASSEILRNLAKTIEKSDCKEIKFKRLPNKVMSNFNNGICEINPIVFDYPLSKIINIIESAIEEPCLIL